MGFDDRADRAAGTPRQAPIIYWNLCQGIPPIVIESPGQFFVVQAIVLVFGAAIVVALLLIF
jgi:hypothetical protein